MTVKGKEVPKKVSATSGTRPGIKRTKEFGSPSEGGAW